MVKVIVDTNILFSALISPNSNIAKLLTNPSLPIKRVTCHYTMVELFTIVNKNDPKPAIRRTSG